jgi:DNA repair protein RecO (recombination protein O)
MLRRVAYGESDLIVTMLTRDLGVVSALARSARKTHKRFVGALEPMHTLRVELVERVGAELMTLRDSVIDVPRRELTADLERMEAAGRALGWVRRGAPERTAEPDAWQVLTELLDQLDTPADHHAPVVHLAACGLRLLSAFGWGLDFERCVVTGRVCEAGRPAMIDATRGGLVSRAAGGARLQLSGAQRERLLWASRGRAGALQTSDADVVLGLIEEALRAHVGGS